MIDFYVINRRIKATFEHPFLVRRADAWGFCSAELLTVGDRPIAPATDGTFAEEAIESIERIDGRVRTVAIHIPGTNTFLAEGVWTHNDASSSSGPVLTDHSESLSSDSSSSSLSSGSKSSGSSFTGSSSSGIVPTVVTGSSDSGSGTGFTNQSNRSDSGSGFTFGNSGGSGGGLGESAKQ